MYTVLSMVFRKIFVDAVVLFGWVVVMVERCSLACLDLPSTGQWCCSVVAVYIERDSLLPTSGALLLIY